MRRFAVGVIVSMVVAAPAAAADPLAEGGTRLVGAAAPGAFTPLPIPVDFTNGTSSSLSSDGSLVAFSSSSDGLSGDDDDTVSNVYVKNRATGAIELVSRRDGAAGAPADADCTGGSISNDGTKVAFSCDGPLADADTNGKSDVYVRDRVAQTTRLVSRTNAAVGDGDSGSAAISGNGDYVAFTSKATNLGATGDFSGRVYRRTLASNAVALVDGAQFSPASSPPASALYPSISADGNRVAFASQARNLVTGLTYDSDYQVYWRDVTAGTTGLVSGSNVAGHTGNTAAVFSVISGNGAYVAYQTGASDVGDGDADFSDDVHRRRLSDNSVVLIDRKTGEVGDKAASGRLGGIDSTGNAVLFATETKLDDQAVGPAAYIRHVGSGALSTTELATFRSTDTGPVTGVALSPDAEVALFSGVHFTSDSDPVEAVLFASQNGQVDQVSRPPGGDPFVNLGAEAKYAGANSVSDDGRYVLFASAAQGLPGAGPPALHELWRRDTLTGDVVLVSRADGASGAASTYPVDSGTISADGNRVVFRASFGSDILWTAYLRDIAAGTTTAVSRLDGEVTSAVGAAIAPDGRHVAFASFVSSGPISGDYELFVTDVTAGTQRKVAVTGNPTDPRLSRDGSVVVFSTQDGSPSPATHVYLSRGDAAPVQLDQAGAESSTDPTISADGSRVAFVTREPLIPADTDTRSDVYVVDVASRAYTRVTETVDGQPPSYESYTPQISADGTHVAFGSEAKNLVAGDDSRADVFVRDLAKRTTVLASPGITGSIGTYYPATDADGGCVVFDTPTLGLAPGLTTPVARVWMHAVSGTCPKPAAAAATPIPAPSATPSPSPTPTPAPGKPARPKVSGFSAKPKRFKTHGKQRGTRFSFTLDQAATVKIVVVRVRRKRAKRVATLTVKGKRGKNTIRFRRRHLKAGRYRATLTARSAGGTSKPVSIKLRARRG